MAQSAKHFPDESINPPGPDTFFNSQTAQPNAWQDVDNGVSTPDDTKTWWCFGAAKSGYVKFDWTGLPADIDEVTSFHFSLRWTGLAILYYASAKFYLYTDYPTPLARLVSSVIKGMGTGGVTTNGTIVFSGISMTRDELLEARVYIEPFNGGLLDPGPDPYEEP